MIRLAVAFLSGLFLRSLVERWYRDAVEELADAEVERRTEPYGANVVPLTPRERINALRMMEGLAPLKGWGGLLPLDEYDDLAQNAGA